MHLSFSEQFRFMPRQGKKDHLRDLGWIFTECPTLISMMVRSI
jgi:hypothetical protein